MGLSIGWVESFNDVFMFFPKLCFYVSFHTKLLLSHLLGNHVVFVAKLVDTTMLKSSLSNNIDNIMLYVGMPTPNFKLSFGISCVFYPCNFMFYGCFLFLYKFPH